MWHVFFGAAPPENTELTQIRAHAIKLPCRGVCEAHEYGRISACGAVTFSCLLCFQVVSFKSSLLRKLEELGLTQLAAAGLGESWYLKRCFVAPLTGVHDSTAAAAAGGRAAI